MKKRILTILACLLMLINVFAFSACTNSDLEAKIADLQAKIEELEEQLELREKENKEFAQGQIIELLRAYDLNFITKDELMSIAYYHNGGRRGNEEIMSEDYVPQPKKPENLSEDVKLKITQELLNNINNDYLSEEDIQIIYYGTYNGVVVFFPIFSGPYNDVFLELNYRGVQILYTSQHSLFLDLICVYII